MSYSGDPAASAVDEVRFLVGDTDDSKEILSDKEVTYYVNSDSGGNPTTSGNFTAAAHCADAIAAKFSRNVDGTTGDLQRSWSQRVKQYQDLAAQLRRRATLRGVPVFFTGQSISEKNSANTDPDRVQPAVKIDGMNDATPNALTASVDPSNI